MTISDMNEFGGTWTQNKLQILRGYLESYTTALKKQDFNLVYVDAFAGTGYINPNSPDEKQAQPVWGEELDEEAREFFKGSTRLALEVADRPFDKFLFIEQNRSFIGALNALKEEFADREIQTWPGDANDVLRLWCEVQSERLGTPWWGERAVIFLDPFATEVEWTTVSAIAATKSVDVWILFPISALTRNLPTERLPYPGNATMLDRVYGGAEWRNLYRAVKPPPTQLGMFEEVRTSEEQLIRDEQRAIVEVYLDKLRTIFPAVSQRPKWFYNSRNSPLFAFMFAAANPGTGGKIALDIANYLLDRW
ncbi:MAG: three-Cys-motif partner protein TcmP [Chloroflexota bacterium]|nr:three-Cys-motif partner protein TcmP [Chloroflexota bacterium]